MSSKIEVRLLENSDYDLWERLVAESPDGSPYASPRYLDALCTAAGGEFRILVAYKGDELVGGVPLYETAHRRLRTAGPRLLLYYLGPVLRRFESRYPSAHTARAVSSLNALCESIENIGFDRVTLKGRHTIDDVRAFASRGWSVWPSYSYVVPLDNMDEQRGRVEQNIRRLIERGSDSGLEITEDDDMASFLNQHDRTMALHGESPYLGSAAFRRWFEILSGDNLARLFHARLPGGESIASQIVLASAHPVSHTVCAAGNPAHRASGAAAFLRWGVFEKLSALGFKGNDLTDAALNPVTHFKSQLGGELVANFVLESPPTVRWTALHQVSSVYRGARRALRSALHSVRRSSDV